MTVATTRRRLLLLLLVTLSLAAAECHNITAILSSHPEYSQFNSYLTQTKLADEINNRQPITVLALTNAAMSSLLSKNPSISVVKSALSLHVLLDYFDAPKLHKIADGSTLSTTLYQTTGNAGDKLGFVNITDLRGGKVGFGSGVPGSALDSSYTKEIKKEPYSLSVIEISQPIIAPAIMSAKAPSASNTNITALLEKAGCKTFASLIVSSGVIKVYETAKEKGLTIFAPSDEAFKANGLPDLAKLTNAELVSLLQYHALASYSPIGTLKSNKNRPMSTLATNAAGKYDIGVTTAGDEVTLKSGLGTSRVASTVTDTTPLCIFTVDSVLLPAELFGKAPSPAPAGEPVASPSPAEEAPKLAPGSAEAPASVVSPPAPPMESPEGSPADAPSEAADSSSEKSAAADVALFGGLVTVSVSVILSVFLS